MPTPHTHTHKVPRCLLDSLFSATAVSFPPVTIEGVVRPVGLHGCFKARSRGNETDPPVKKNTAVRHQTRLEDVNECFPGFLARRREPKSSSGNSALLTAVTKTTVFDSTQRSKCSRAFIHSKNNKKGVLSYITGSSGSSSYV